LDLGTISAAQRQASHDPELGRASAALILLWAVGTLGLEGVAQAGAALALILAVAARRRIRIAADLRPFALLTLAYAGWQAISPLLALGLGMVPHLPRAARWTQALNTLAPLVLAAVATFGVPWRALAWLLGLGWLFQTGLGLFQALVPWPWASWGRFKFPLSRLHENFGADGGPVRRAGLGLYFHRLKYANAAVAMLGPATAFLAMGATWRRRALGLLSTAALLGCALMSYARTAFAGAVVAVLVGLAGLVTGARRLGAFAVAALAMGLFALSPTWQQRAQTALQSAHGGERSDAWHLGLRIIQEHPVLGVGFGNYEQAARPLLRPEMSEVLASSAHNVALTVWAETGVPGLLLYLAQQVALALALWRRLRRGSILAGGGLVSLVGFHVIGLAHFPQYHSGVALTFALLWGLALAPGAPGEEPAAPADG
jgi:O-antigen ligase